MTSFVLLSQCSDTALTPELLAQIASALEIQLDRDVSAWWGGDSRVRAATPDNPPAEGEVVALILDTLPDAPGAVAYHNWQGVPSIYVARDMCPSLTTGTYSLSQALSHELCETVGDIGTNLWADDMAGAEWAHELCDAVEQGFYTIEGIDVSDFVLPSFFNPGDTSGRYSYMNAAQAPFTTAPGGYQVQRVSGTGETQVQDRWEEKQIEIAGYLEWVRSARLAKKRHWSSRTARRLGQR